MNKNARKPSPDSSFAILKQIYGYSNAIWFTTMFVSIWINAMFVVVGLLCKIRCGRIEYLYCGLEENMLKSKITVKLSGWWMKAR